MFHERLQNHWGELLKEEFTKPYFQHLTEFLQKEYNEKIVFPKKEDVFNALLHTDYEQVKVVLLGQDPYHGEGQAHGFSFSVRPGVKIPPSLRNIFKELHDDLGCAIPNHGSLLSWADQGVLLLNTVLTVREGEAHSHKGTGWEVLTDRIISLLNEREEPVIFLLWGKPAQLKAKKIDQKKHVVLTSAHPSPLSARRGFLGSKPFSLTNQHLRNLGKREIDWEIK
ncbi:uracil-DNA glycosylase [Mesobacillus maritimus]|uniref:uracil-DNA glycosylase n=1 Tax=Mesobacillus maritimus TaxID=1643336 RepID=UPI00203B4C3D|nr:uracil-DNA glycosylase [Mesobacillus maritimus]MCM3586819.1 uracil-DNA glycosylase [Mesobacillus maritimus]